MEIKLNFWIRYLLPFFLALFLGTLVYLTAQFREPPGLEWYATLWFFLTIFSIWECGWYVSRKLETYFPWSRGTLQRLAIHLLLTNLIALLLFNGSFLVLNWYENQILGDLNPLGIIHLAVITAEAFIITQIINSIQIGYLLLNNWQKVELEAMEYKKQSLIHRLENIRQNISPQFLHPNFDQLKSLLQESPDLVDNYLNRLAEQQESLKINLDSELAELQTTLSATTPTDLPAAASDAQETAPPVYKTRFLVRSGAKMHLIHWEQIAGFYKDDIVLLLTVEGKKYAVDKSLEELISSLNPGIFFRVNRQCIINAQTILEIRPQGSQLALILSANFPKAITVSQRNVGKFKRWLDQEERQT